MAGMNQIRQIKDLEERCERLGFKITAPDHGYYHNQYGDVIALKPATPDSYPIYRNDAELFIGTIEETIRWLDGVEWGQTYYKMIKATTDKQVARKEQDWRNRRLVEILTSGETE
jgi:hypothetical protein